jgi:hypothetical protein
MRYLAATAAAFALLAAGATAAFAGNHNGPQALAKGTGSVTYSTVDSTTPINRSVCEFITIVGITICNPIGQLPVAQTVVTTAVVESFDFSARLGPNDTVTDPTSGAFGKMSLDYQATTTTATSLTGTGLAVCNSPTFQVAGGCPAPSSSTAPSQTAKATAEVTCLNVVQNRASIGGHVIKFSGNFTPTRGMLFNATDNTVARQQTAPDQFAGSFVSDVPNTCPPPSADAPITDGDIYVQQS